MSRTGRPLLPRLGRKASAAAPAGRTPDVDAVEVVTNRSPELAAELQEAWRDLEEAAKDAKVVNFQACTRSGENWREDPDAVRAVVALLWKYGASDDLAE